jgi:hypothetical protein
VPMSKEKELRIRNSTAEFLIFTRQAGEDGIEVLVAGVARREGSVSGFPTYCRVANSNEAETRAGHNRQGILDGSTVSKSLDPRPGGRLFKPSVVKESLTSAHQWNESVTACHHLFQSSKRPLPETGSCFLEAAQRPHRLSPRSRGERPTREARPVRGRRSCLCTRGPSPADADIGGLSPMGRGADLDCRWKALDVP